MRFSCIRQLLARGKPGHTQHIRWVPFLHGLNTLAKKSLNSDREQHTHQILSIVGTVIITVAQK